MLHKNLSKQGTFKMLAFLKVCLILGQVNVNKIQSRSFDLTKKILANNFNSLSIMPQSLSILLALTISVTSFVINSTWSAVSASTWSLKTFSVPLALKNAFFPSYFLITASIYDCNPSGSTTLSSMSVTFKAYFLLTAIFEVLNFKSV